MKKIVTITRRIDLSKLKVENPTKYAEICEELGYIREAMRHYASRTDSEGLYNAARLAVNLRLHEHARNFLKKALDKAQKNFDFYRLGGGTFPDGSGLMATAYGYLAAQRELVEMRLKVSLLEAKIS